MNTDTAGSEASRGRRNVRCCALRRVLILLVLAALLGVALHSFLEARKAEQRRQDWDDFWGIAVALLNFQDTWQRYPHPVRRAGGDGYGVVEQDPDEEALYSWRFSVIGYGASYKLDQAVNEPWDSPANARWRTVPQPFAYDGWVEGVFDRRPPDSIPTITRAFAITGPGTAFGDGKSEEPRWLREVAPETIVVVEIRNSGLHWMAPGDFDIRTMPETINAPDGRGISSRHGDGFHVLFSDGTVWYLRNDVPFEELRKFFTVDGAKANDRDARLGPYRHD